jgi:ATP-dependent helicase/nuclease subunit A
MSNEPIVTTVVDADEDARTFATDPEHNVVLEASAGTGKTSVLVSRYVNLLTRGVDPANILAITFTRKAAAEMRERIIRQLRRSAEQAIFDRARWMAIRDRLADIQISTIDAFCLSLLREFPLEADLDPGFDMADETEVPRLVEAALDRALAICIGRAKREPELALVLAQLGLSRTREGLAYLLERRLVAWDVLDRFLARGPADVTAEIACGRAVDRIIDLFDGLDGGLQRFLDDGPVDRPRFQLLARDLRSLERCRTAPPATVRGMLKRIEVHFLTADGKPRATERIRGYRNEDYPTPDRGRRHRAEVQRLGPAIENIVRGFSRDLNLVLSRAIRRMFSIALAEYRKALNDRSLLDFSDVLQRAVELLGRMDEFSQSRFRLEGRYQHVLVDEFQDTSRKQWELVSLLVKAWSEGLGVSGHPSIFIVGDRKQSIYRFRDADVAVLHEAAAFIDRLRPESSGRRSISRSFRAVPQLLAFVNDLFAEIATPASRPDDFSYDVRDKFPIDAAHGFEAPRLGVATGGDPDACAAAVAIEIDRVLREETVRDKQTGVSRPAKPGDIGILFRSRASHREFERALEQRGIPTYVYKGLGFFDSDEIKDLSALIRFLASPWSDLRTAAFLRSRFVRLSDAGLALLAPRLSAAVIDAQRPTALDALAEGDRLALEQARRSVPEWLERVDRTPPADLIEELIRETAYAYELRGPRRAQAWENTKKFRALIRRIQNRGYATLARIADHVDSLSAGDESNAVLEALDSVNLMTVHASKGLEFPIVFVVNFSKGASGIPRPVRVSDEDVAVGSFVSETDELERAREREETKRLLYVALTRARDRLYVASVVKEGARAGRGSLAEVLPESFRTLFSRAATASEAEIDWIAASRARHVFRICPSAAGRETSEKDSRAAPPPGAFRDRFAPIADLKPDERVVLDDPSGVDGIKDGECLRSVPFSCVSAADASRVIRGTIPCLIRGLDGQIVVLSEDAERLQLYIDVARAVYPSASISGKLLYST